MRSTRARNDSSASDPPTCAEIPASSISRSKIRSPWFATATRKPFTSELSVETAALSSEIALVMATGQHCTPVRRASQDFYFHPAFIGATPFWLAARFGQPDMMKMLADHGARVDAATQRAYLGDAVVDAALTQASSAASLTSSRHRLPAS